MKQIKLKTEDGEIFDAKTIIISDEPRWHLEELTGLKFRPKRRNVYAQTIGAIRAYMCCNSPNKEEVTNVFTLAQLFVCKCLASEFRGHVCIGSESFIVYVPCPEGQYIFDGNTVMDGIVCGNWSYKNAIKKVETISEKIVTDLNEVFSLEFM